MIPALQRLPGAEPLVRGGASFALHTARQTGRTTFLRALAWEPTRSGDFAAVYLSCEAGEPLGEDVEAVEWVVLSELARNAWLALPEDLRPTALRPEAPAGERIGEALTARGLAWPRPVVLLPDEIDALRGEGLRTVLRQLRAGSPDRPRRFPASVILCGLRDVRDYKAASGGDPRGLGTSCPFNVMKVWADGRPDRLRRGLLQVDRCLEGLGLDRGVLVLFDRRSDLPPAQERTRFERAATPSGRTVTVLRA